MSGVVKVTMRITILPVGGENKIPARMLTRRDPAGGREERGDFPAF